MCNLSETIYQDGIAQGTAISEAVWNARLAKLIKAGFLTAEDAAKSLGLELEDVEAMVAKND